MKKTANAIIPQPPPPPEPVEPKTALGRWMREKGWTDSTLAAVPSLGGLSRSFISALRLGTACPSLPLALELERISEGRVTCRDLCPKGRLLS